MTICTPTDGFLLDAYRALLRDVDSVDPLVHDLLRRDLDGLAAAPDPFFWVVTSYLPKLGKWFDKRLSTNGVWVSPPRLELGSSSEGMDLQSVPFLDALLRDIGGTQGLIAGDPGNLDPNTVLMARQLLYFVKRWKAPCARERVVEAVQEFWEVDQDLRTPRTVDTDLMFHVQSGTFSEGLQSDATPTLKRLVSTLDYLAKRLAPTRELDVYSLTPKHGPGAVSDLPSGGDKYSFPNYPQIIEDVMPAAFFCSVNEMVDHSATICRSKVSAKLVAVPKTMDKPRLIASEPVAHQYLQQALMKWIRDNMCPIHKVMVNFSSQEPSRKAALAASAGSGHATIDLSSASDRLSMWVVESYFSSSPDLLDLLTRTRSSSCFDGIWRGEAMELRKFAPMGSAVTFPVQSLIYAAAALAASIVTEGYAGKLPLKTSVLKRLARRIRVFGDDLIVPETSVPHLCLLLEFLQLKVNSSKSHVSGRFRESCGMDAYGGYDVTPAYMSQEAPSTPGSNLVAYVEQSNNMHNRGFWNLAAWMIDQLPDFQRRLLVVSSTRTGVLTLTTTCKGTVASRFRDNKFLHRPEMRGLAPSSRARTKRRDSFASLLQYFLEVPSSQEDDDPLDWQVRILERWESGVRSSTPVKLKPGWAESRELITFRSKDL